MLSVANDLPSFDGGDAGFLNAFILGSGGCDHNKRSLDEVISHDAAKTIAAAVGAAAAGAAAGIDMTWSVELPRGYNFTSHWVREATFQQFATLWEKSSAPYVPGSGGGSTVAGTGGQEQGPE